jgi:predicted cation transporter
MLLGLWCILALVLVLPFSLRQVEEQLELFLFIMGAAAVTLTGQWHGGLVAEALREPLSITLAVLCAGGLFRLGQAKLDHNVGRLAGWLGPRGFVFLVVTGLGLLSSVITAIIASLVLVEIVSYLKFDRRTEIRLVIIACFAIGLGAALTPIGEPLSTLAVAKLRGEPHHAGFGFLLQHLGVYILPGVLGLGGLAAWVVGRGTEGHYSLREKRHEKLQDILVRTVKVYVFVAALVLLGEGFRPLIDLFIAKIPPAGLFWLNSVSAVLDNATLAAAELAPSMNLGQIKFALMGLIVAGGMLIPGNIPNIISAGKLGIKSREWAAFGVPLGAVLMAAYFLALSLAG